MRRALFVADLVGIGLALSVTYLTGTESAWFLASWPIWLLLGKFYGLYHGDEERAHHSTVQDVGGVFHVGTVGMFLVLVISLVFGTSADPRGLAFFWAVAMFFVLAMRVVGRGLARKSTAYLQNTVIVGAGDVGQLIARKILQHPEYRINLLGFVDANPKTRRGDLEDLTILGATDELKEILHTLEVERVVIAFSGETNEDTLALVRSLRDASVQIDIVPRLFEAVGPSADMHTIEGLPLVGLPSIRITRTSRWTKRAIDILVAAILLVLSAPLFALIAWRIRRDSSGPILFRQERLGMNMTPFTMLKFRTMHTDTDQAAHREYIRQAMDTALSPNANGLYKLGREDAVTSIGRKLRKSSMDELPQLINVLRGEMSLVGPRPCIAYETEYFESYHFERFLVPQGITGLWQVEGRALMTPKEALDLDVAYARGWSLGLDFSLLMRTVWMVLFKKGAA